MTFGSIPHAAVLWLFGRLHAVPQEWVYDISNKKAALSSEFSKSIYDLSHSGLLPYFFHSYKQLLFMRIRAFLSRFLDKA